MKDFMIKMCNITFTSFTICVLCLCAFVRIGLTDYNTGTELLPASILLQFFVFCATIGILMPLWNRLEDRLNINSLLLDSALRLLLCYLVVFLEGSAFGMFAFSLRSFLTITPIMIPVFAVTWIVHYTSIIEYASSVNKAIRKRREHL